MLVILSVFGILPDCDRLPGATVCCTRGSESYPVDLLDSAHMGSAYFHQASMGKQRSDGALVQGTLDMLILKTLAREPMHGYGIAQSIQLISDEVLRVEEGSLYPALHRLELDGMIDSEWRQSANNRRAKYYRLTAHGRKQLVKETNDWSRLAKAIARVMEIA